ATAEFKIDISRINWPRPCSSSRCAVNPTHQCRHWLLTNQTIFNKNENLCLGTWEVIGPDSAVHAEKRRSRSLQRKRPKPLRGLGAAPSAGRKARPSSSPFGNLEPETAAIRDA